MKRGLIVYNEVDQEKNAWFINRALEILNKDDISLSYLEEDFLLEYVRTQDLDFVIYRGRKAEIVEFLENQGILVFNNSLTNKTANNKYITYQFFKDNELSSIPTYLESSTLSFPYIMKSVSGHGGSEVFLVNSEEERNAIFEAHSNLAFIYQPFIPHEGDVRIFLLNEQIIGAVKRISHNDFRSNYSLGGEVSSFDLTKEMEEAALKIAHLLKATYIGVDLLLTEDGYLFNEIEDPVGSRMLLKASNIDSVTLFLNRVKEIVSK